jgi:hypothetical protein
MQTRMLLKLSLAMLAGVGISLATLASPHAQTPTGGKPRTGADDSTVRALTTTPTDVQWFAISFPAPAISGACLEQGGASLSIRSDGQAVWGSQVSSSDSNNSFCHDLHLYDKNGTLLYSWGRFCSPTLSSTPQLWTTSLTFPQYMYPYIVTAHRDNHC